MADTAETSALRAELYACRRSLTQTTMQRDGLAARVRELEAANAALQEQAEHASALERLLAEAAQQRAADAEDALANAEDVAPAAQKLGGAAAEQANGAERLAAPARAVAARARGLGSGEPTQTLDSQAGMASASQAGQARASGDEGGAGNLKEGLPNLASKPEAEGGALELQGASAAQAALAAEALNRLQGQVAGLRASRDKLLLELDEQAAEAQRLVLENGVLQQGLAEAREAAGTWEAQAQSGLAQVDRLKDLLEETARWSPQTLTQNPKPTPEPRDAGAGPASASGRSDAAAGGSDIMAAPASGPNTGLVTGSGFQSAAAPSNAGAPAAEAGRAGSEEADRVAVEDRGQQVVAEAAAAAAAEAVALRQTCGELEQQLRWQRAAAAASDLAMRALAAELARASEVSGDLARSVLPALAGVEGRLDRLLRN